MKRRLAISLATCTGLISASMFASAAHAQQGPYNYFSRTPETERVLRSNETHHLGKGTDYLRAGTTAGLGSAKSEFDFILNLWPNHPGVLSLQADTLIRLGQGHLIEQYFGRAYQMTPDVAQLRVVHGVALLRQNKVKESIEQLRRGVELDESSVNGHYNLGLALVSAKRYEEANLHAQRAYALGHPLPGLRDQLKRAKAWNPGAAAPAAEADKKPQ